MTAQEKLIQTAKAEEGYLEKASSSAKYLDSKTANAGRANITKYTRDLMAWLPFTGDTFRQGYAWCAIFVTWCFYKAFGKSDAYELLCHCWTSYTPAMGYAFYKAGKLRKDPAVGAIVFFYDRTKESIDRWKGIYHVGIVVAYDADSVWTVEGNTSSATGVVENGGCVRLKKYSRGYSKIYGYGCPDFGKLAFEDDEAVNVTLGGEKMDYTALVKAVYTAVLGRDVDEGGLATWTAALKAGTVKPDEFVSQIAASVEAKANAKALRERFVRLAYKALLGRNPRPEEVETWAGKELSVDEILRKIEKSQEYQARIGK